MKIISCGQTGADQAALDAAIHLGLDYGGAVPRDRRTEAGPLDRRYDRMVELGTPDPAAATDKNVRDSDVTLIFTMGTLGSGTLLTMKKAMRHDKPCLHIDLEEMIERDAADAVRALIGDHVPRILNVAGNRESKAPGIHDKVFRVLVNAINPYKAPHERLGRAVRNLMSIERGGDERLAAAMKEIGFLVSENLIHDSRVMRKLAKAASIIRDSEGEIAPRIEEMNPRAKQKLAESIFEAFCLVEREFHEMKRKADEK